MTVTDDECRHGLANRECDACFPKARPETPVVTSTRASRSKAATLARSTAAEAASLDLAAQRVYHLTHIDNLAGILAAQAIRSDAEGASPSVDISSPHAREARRMITVDDEGHTVADYVPFFLSPNAHVWNSIRAGHDDPRLTLEALGYAASEFVLLVSTVKHAFDAATAQAAAAVDSDAADAADGSLGGFAVADGDAVGLLTNFATTRADAERMLKRLRADDESESILGAEVLVADTFPFEQISLIGVANDKVRATVRGILSDAGHKTKVAVYPPWFQATEDIAE